MGWFIRAIRPDKQDWLALGMGGKLEMAGGTSAEEGVADEARAWEDVIDEAAMPPESADLARLTKWDLRKIRTRRLILHAGREVFAEKGFDAPKVEDVARTAGISRAAFYLHFKSLDELLSSIFHREMRWQLRRYRTLNWDILQNKRKLRGWLERFCASFRQERNYVLVLYRAFSVDPANMRTVYQDHEQLVQRLGRRIPQLRLSDANGAPDPVRVARLYAVIRLLEDVSLFTAFDSWIGPMDIAIDLVADQLHSFAMEAAGPTDTPEADA